MATQKFREKVLIICNHNSARSQIAEGLLKSLYGEYYDVYSAGSQPTTVNIYAIKVLEEIGVDISENRSKSLKEFEGLEFDYVVTVCEGEVKHVHFSLEEKLIFINHLKILQRLMG